MHSQLIGARHEFSYQFDVRAMGIFCDKSDTPSSTCRCLILTALKVELYARGGSHRGGRAQEIILYYLAFTWVTTPPPVVILDVYTSTIQDRAQANRASHLSLVCLPGCGSMY